MELRSPRRRAALVLAALSIACELHGVDAQNKPPPGLGPFHRRRVVAKGFTVRLGGTLGFTGKYRVTSLHTYRGLKLFEEVANNYSLFRTPSDEPIRLSLDIKDDQSSKAEVTRLYQEMVDSKQYDAFLGPYSSTLSLEAARVTNRSGQLIMMHQAASPTVYEQGFQRVFSVGVMATDYTAGALRLLYERGARTVALAQGPSLFHASICAGAKYHAQQLGFQVVSEVSIAETDITAGIKQSAKKSPDVLVGCGHLHNAIQVTVTSRALMFNTKAMIMVQAADANFMSVVQAPNANYIIGPVTWDRSLPQGCDAFGSADAFYQLYVERWNAEPTYHSAQAAAAGIVMMDIFELLGPQASPLQLEKKLQTMPMFHTLVGDITFNMSGLRIGGMGLAKQFQPTEGNSSTTAQGPRSVKPVLIRNSVDLVYPMPSWEQKELDLYPCPLGYVVIETSQGSQCEVCPVGYYRSKASLTCRSCPNGTYGLQAGLSECSTCGTGMDCEGVRSTGQLIAVEGWYLMPSSETFIQCSAKACLAENQCASTQKGVLCSQCREGYTNLGPWASGSVMCHKCPHAIWELVGFLVLLIVSQAIFLIVVRSHHASCDSLTALHTVILRILLSYFTSFATFIAASADLGIMEYRGFRFVLAIFLDPLSTFFSLDCWSLIFGVQRSFEVHIVVGLLLVPVLLILSFTAVLLRQLVPVLYRNAVEEADQVLSPEERGDVHFGIGRNTEHLSSGISGPPADEGIASGTSGIVGDETESIRSGVDTIMKAEDGKVQIHSFGVQTSGLPAKNHWDHLFHNVQMSFLRRAIIWIFLTYPIVVYMLMAGATCVEKDTLRLRTSLDIVCQSSEHVAWFRLSAFGLISYGVGIPCIVFCQLFRVRHQLLDVNIRQNYGFLSNGFEPRFYWFEIIYMVRKLAVLAALAIPYTDTRLLFMLGIGLIFMGIHIRCEPYDDRDLFVLDRLEFLSIASFVCSCFGGVWFEFVLRMRSRSTVSTAFIKVVNSEVVSWTVLGAVFCVHAAFLCMAIWSLLRHVLLKHSRFLEECFPERLSTIQKCVLRLAEKQWHHVRMDPDTHELDISQLSGQERHFLYVALCDTMAAYIDAAVRPMEVPPVSAGGGKASKACGPASRDFYVGFMIAALVRAYKRVEHSRFMRCVHYRQALEEECREQDGWLKRKLRFWSRGPSYNMEATADGVQPPRSSSTMDSGSASKVSLKFHSAMAWLNGSKPMASAVPADKQTAEQRAASSIRNLGVTVEELHLALMLSWTDITEGKDEYFVLETDEDRERAFRREVLCAKGMTWSDDHSVNRLFKSLELRRQLQKSAGDAALPPLPKTPPPELADDALGVEALLGLQSAAEEQASRKALRQEHEERLVEVLELRSKVRDLELRLQAMSEVADKPQLPDMPHDSPELARVQPEDLLAEGASPGEVNPAAQTPTQSPQLEHAAAAPSAASSTSSSPREPPGEAGAAGQPFSAILTSNAESGAERGPAELPPALPPDEQPPVVEPLEAPPDTLQPPKTLAASVGGPAVAAKAVEGAAEVEQSAHPPADNATPQPQPGTWGSPEFLDEGRIVQI